jgi:hypothetical protein
MSEMYEWATRTELADGRVFFTEKPSGEADARRAFDDSVRDMRRRPGRTTKVELLSRPVGSWGVVDSAEAS